MILVDRLVGERLPFGSVRGGDDDPLPEGLAAAGGVEEVRPWNRQTRVWAPGSVSLKTIAFSDRMKPAMTRPERFRQGIPKTFERRTSGCQAVSASQISS